MADRGGSGSVGAVVAELVCRLSDAGVPTPEVDAELLVRHVAGWSRSQLVSRKTEDLPAEHLASLEEAAARREAREPLQLIVGSVGFRYLDIEVRAGVFIPRPETEVLAGEAVSRLHEGGVAVEPCTGSGAVACALATERRDVTVVATDVSETAVALARDNARRVGAALDVRQGDLLEPVADLRGRIDVLVSNPPYVAADELGDLEPEVVRHDPISALVSGPTGHEVSDRLIAAAADGWLCSGGWLLLEVAEHRAVEAAARCMQAGLTEAAVRADLAGRDRVVVARRP